jgi:hypothetical protein
MNHDLVRSFVLLCALAAAACAGETSSDDVDVDAVDVDVQTPALEPQCADCFLKLGPVVGEPTAPRTAIFR